MIPALRDLMSSSGLSEYLLLTCGMHKLMQEYTCMHVRKKEEGGGWKERNLLKEQPLTRKTMEANI